MSIALWMEMSGLQIEPLFAKVAGAGFPFGILTEYGHRTNSGCFNSIVS